ncbi:phage holin family protein [Streptomyces sp. TRM 70351]|uniref:phage holin family protein n=1 Tax=Streptomyces sp. TRM 70351 TaxID=3116552 RepID=UPI002E7B30D7|nr:phage holin family protein [Streptomyces sp. TRM 70351]MEE1930265.1 phage holin family protein [Streptomyces sp. TRM 70351]
MSAADEDSAVHGGRAVHGGAGTREAGGARDGRSLGQLVASATAEMSALVHEEIALAKTEMKDSVNRGIAGSGAIIVAGVLALFSLPVFSFALAYWLHAWWKIPLALALTVVGVIMLVFALVCGLVAKSLLQKIQAPRRSIASAKETAGLLTHAKPHPRAASDGRATGGRAVDFRKADTPVPAGKK